MNINVEHQPNCRAVAHVRVPGEEVAKQRNAVISHFARNVRLPGFRPGKVPAAAVLKRFGTEVNQELEKQLVNDGLRQAIRNEGLEVISVLSVKDKMIHDTDQSFSFSAEMSLVPRFELPEYKGIPVKLPRIEVTDADVDHDLLHLREKYATFQDVDRGAGNGDAVVLQCRGSLAGQPLAEAMPDAPNHLKEIEENWFLLDSEEDFLPGFYAGLQGIAKGEERTLTIPLPDQFPFEPLRSQNLDMHVICKGVKERALPEIDGAFLAKLGGADMTEETLREEIRAGIRKRREQARETTKVNQVLTHILGRVEFDLPQEVVNREAQRRTNDIAMRAMQEGVASEELLSHQDEILNTATQQARQSVKVRFVLEQIAAKEALGVSDQKLTYALTSIAGRQKQPVKKFLAEAQRTGLVASVRDDLLIQEALEFLADHAEVEETDPEPEICETHGGADAAKA